MSLTDNLFTEDLEEDLQHFLRLENCKRVLVFPPVNNYRRFLIHQLVQERYALLQTFSIGQGFARRTVVCYKSDFIGPPKVNGVLEQSNDFFGGKNFKRMGIENQCTPISSPETTPQRTRMIRTTPAQEIYRPPAARKVTPNKSPVHEQNPLDTSSRTKRQKRPDRAVYVPKHRRGSTDLETPSNLVPSEHTKLPVEPVKLRQHLNINFLKEAEFSEGVLNSSLNPEGNTEAMLQNVVDEQKDVENTPIATETEIHVELKEKEGDAKCEADLAIGSVNEQQVIASTTSNEIIIISDSSSEEADQNSKFVESSEEPLILLDKNDSEKYMNYEKTIEIDDEADQRDRRKNVEANAENDNIEDTDTEESNGYLINTEVSQTTSAVEELDKNVSDLNDVEKSPNEMIISEVLIISTPEIKEEKVNEVPTSISPIPSSKPPEKKFKKQKKTKDTSTVLSPSPPQTTSAVKLNRDECDWEALFDDNGDCLDPTLIEELASAVGEVTIEQPKSSYKAFTRPVEVSNDEFAHVVEIYNFPSEFKSSDLAIVFSPFKSNGFELKWVDDTHCLGVFSSPLVAAEVLASEHPFVKTRPLSEATNLSKAKVRRSSEFLQPYRARPETCAALARRLVTKSLGVTLATARQEREQERIVLREAKEKKKLANKQREDVWEGIV